MTVKSPEPLPEWHDKFVMPEGRFSSEFYRWLVDSQNVLQAAVNFINVPPPPTPVYELVEDWPVIIPFPANKTYPLLPDSSAEKTITEVITKCVSGTCTVTLYIDGVALGGSANSVSSTKQTQSHSTANVIPVGGRVTAVVTSASSCVDMELEFVTTRDLTS